MNDAPTPPYEFWYAALQGTPIGSDELPVYADQPQCGFSRMRRGIKSPWEAVAIFERDDRLVALVDGNEVPPTSIWHWACVHPISENAYHHARETGGEWGDLDDTVLLLQSQDAVPERFKTSAPYERLKQQIDLAIGSAKLYDVIVDDTTSLKAQSLRAKLLELSNTADKLRETEKRPHFQQAKLVDSVWMPVVKGAQEAAGTIRRALSRYETLKAAEAVIQRRNEPLPTRVSPATDAPPRSATKPSSRMSRIGRRCSPTTPTTSVRVTQL